MLHDRFVQTLVASLIIALAIVALATWLGSRWLSNNREERSDRLLDGSADSADFDITLEACGPAGDATEAAVHLTNRAGASASYVIEVAFTGPRGFLLDTVEASTPLLDPDSTTTLEIRTSATGAGQAGTHCALISVDDGVPGLTRDS